MSSLLAVPPQSSAADWNARFAAWSRGPAATEQEKCDNAVRLVREAVVAHPALRSRNIRVFAQGSYRNRTNVRQESDVDVCVLCTDVFFPDYSLVPGVSNATFGFTDAAYHLSDFKNDVLNALVLRFGANGVTRGNRAIDVHENTYRVAADAVPTFERRVYYREGNEFRYRSGVTLESSSGGVRIHNWPEQHHQNGVAKHERTGRRYKKSVRILKCLRNSMEAAGVESAQRVPSFLVESLVYNCSDEVFAEAEHYSRMKQIIAHAWRETREGASSHVLLEANGIKPLFESSQRWTLAHANLFLADAWHFVGFGSS